MNTEGINGTANCCLSSHITPPTRRNKMVDFAKTMRQRFTTTVRQIFTFLVRRERKIEIETIDREVNEAMDLFSYGYSRSDFQQMRRNGCFGNSVPLGVLETQQELKAKDMTARESKIKSYLMTTLFERWLIRIIYQLETKEKTDIVVKPSALLMGDIEDILSKLVEIDEAEVVNQESSKRQRKTGALSMFLFRHMTDSLTSSGSLPEISVYSDLYHEILDMASKFIETMDWWQETQVEPLAQMISDHFLENRTTPSPVVEHQSSVAPKTPGEPAHDDKAQKRPKLFIKTIVEQVHGKCPNPTDTHMKYCENRMNNYYTSVRDQDLVITQLSTNLCKGIDKGDDLSCLTTVAGVDGIVSVIKDNVMPQTKGNCIQNFFRSIRRENQVSPSPPPAPSTPPLFLSGVTTVASVCPPPSVPTKKLNCIQNFFRSIGRAFPFRGGNKVSPSPPPPPCP